MEDHERFYEGCNREGPLRCIFLCEFHHVAGPKIACQVPENYISKDFFDAVSVYIIPKAQLQRSTITVVLYDLKVLGFPVRIDNKKYARNAYHYNLCFVCDAWARTVQYEPVVKKLADYLMAMEVENHFLSKYNQKAGDHGRLVRMLRQILHDLNTHRMCTLTEGTTTTHLKVIRISRDPEPVEDHHVPIFIQDQNTFRSEQWDLTTNQVLPYIDGFNHVAKIAAEADVENNLVKACVQNLVYYGVVTLVPIFQYSNVYAATPKLKLLAEDADLQERCLKFVSRSVRQLPLFRDVFRMYAGMNVGTTIRDLCIRFSPHPRQINERKLVQFGVLEGLIRRIHKFPVHILASECSSSASSLSQTRSQQYQPYQQRQEERPQHIPMVFTGVSCEDEICCSLGISTLQLEEELDQDPGIAVIWK
ncbi:GATOR complex protein NPRL2-like [Schistocerca gregaria]|uniref:GATOR complex protein NPRL2-like n=1 Tax=Schistocerca gregaria TaxID=7010 RepID=UPI00211E26FD|nr:GATOR complex protein NPRL2-like [Schistocerca gregaria]